MGCRELGAKSPVWKADRCILDIFSTLRRKDEGKFAGDYRTKRVILESYDAMLTATRTGQSYPPRLDPPPAHPRVAHPPRNR